MSCETCTAARETAGRWVYFDPACLWCGGRLIQRIGKVKAMPSEIAQRRRVVLRDWMQYGHGEAQLRELAKAAESLEPVRRGR